MFNISDDWRCDQYRWIHNGCKLLPKSNPKVRKFYFKIQKCKSSEADDNEHRKVEFERIAYHLLDNPNIFLIQYIGDNSIAADFSHGNSKSDHKPYVRTCPSVIKEIRESDPSEFPSAYYKKALSTSSGYSLSNPSLQLRNTRQVVNHKALERQKRRLSHDELYNIHEISYDLDGFVSKIVTYPDLVVICGHPQILKEMSNLLLIGNNNGQLFSYDTTFELGDIYVSAFLMRHMLFMGAPVIPVAFLLHERKLESSHEEFMKFISIKFPILCQKGHPFKFPLVTDEEQAICSAIDKHIPGFIRLRCWNHTVSAARFWLKKHNATAEEIPIYLEDLRTLFHMASLEEYETCLEGLKVSSNCVT